jgi:GNAT superfamily N-acetyltransferase
MDIVRLRLEPETVSALADLLVETVANGGSVSFMHPLAPEVAAGFWTRSLTAADAGERVVLGAMEDGQLVSTVTLLLDCPPNQPHRGEIAKMMTRVSRRGRGIARTLMIEAERIACEQSRTLLTLDTADDEGAGPFYEKLGFTRSGVIPDYALKPYGGLCGTILYWKRIGATGSPPAVFQSAKAMISERIDAIDWPSTTDHLSQYGWAVIPRMLDADQAAAIAALYDDRDTPFRSHIVMARHGFGQGEYRYFDYPLPPIVETLREGLYPRLAPLANQWNTAMGSPVSFPETHAEFVERCHAAGQRRPTPLLLRYGPGDYNCLHQDVYGEHLFPMQVTFLLAKPGTDFDGGEFVLVEQRPRMQSRPMVVPLGLGDGVIFAVNQRPVQGQRGTYRVTLRHGVSEIRSGQRHTLGVIFHDAT